MRRFQRAQGATAPHETLSASAPRGREARRARALGSSEATIIRLNLGLAQLAGARWGEARETFEHALLAFEQERAERLADGRAPAGPGGRRRFEVALGNKMDKLDLESVLVVRLAAGERALAFGSGSAPARERIAVIDAGAATARLHDARELYARLREERAFSGSELNVEGAVAVGGTLRLFQRGNGAAREGDGAVNASVDLSLEAFVAWIEERGPLPPLDRVRRYDLGHERGVPYGFTDATALPDGSVLFVAGAEDSPDVIEDGEVLGARIGIARGDEVRWAPLEEPDGTLSTAKIEGLAPSSEPGRVHAVTDMDDPDRPSLLCEIALDGPW